MPFLCVGRVPREVMQTIGELRVRDDHVTRVPLEHIAQVDLAQRLAEALLAAPEHFRRQLKTR